MKGIGAGDSAGVGSVLVELSEHDRQWSDVYEAYQFVRARRAVVIEGGGYRVERGPGTDITIIIRAGV